MKPSPAASSLPESSKQLYLLPSELDVPADICVSLSTNPSFATLRQLLREKEEKKREPTPFLTPLSENRLVFPLPQARSVPRKLPFLHETRPTPRTNNPSKLTLSVPKVLPKPEILTEFRVEVEKGGAVDRGEREVGEWGRKWEWSDNLRMMNKHIFHNEEFRENQEEAINASLSGRDVFVCMPTGGGKSLTFQLPALIEPGITVVVMPLISLIHDQVEYLRRIAVKVIVFDSFQKASEQESSFSSLSSSTDTHLLYLTPEKLSQNDRLLSCLSSLHRSHRIARFVVDEAHCISKWGRDFRPDYLKLASLRHQFPGVPILTLTATATETVRQDIMDVLGMRNTVVFLSSFNRKNLFYAVRGKTRNSIADLAAFVAAKHQSHTGIVYCLSCKDCERVAKELKNTYRLSAGYYHAKLKPEKRTSVHQAWMREAVKILCATVAFGMGINKANVRFVVHFSMPKSLESYYQEAGRAGRDGRPADCVVYYWYADKARQERLGSKIRGERVENSGELMKMVRYCEDIFTCRRQQQLSHFGEAFDPSLCHRSCDNCLAARIPIPHDLTPHTLLILTVLQRALPGLTTLNQMVQFLTGEHGKFSENVQEAEGFGGLKSLPKCDIERLLHQLVFEEVLCETGLRKFAFYVAMNLRPGTHTEDVFSGRKKVIVMYESQRKVSIPHMSSERQQCVAVSLARVASEEIDIENAPAKDVGPSSPQMTSDLYLELFERLSVVRRKLASKAGQIFPDSLLDQLIVNQPRSQTEAEQLGLTIPKEFIQEIKYFTEINGLKHPSDEESVISIEDSSDEDHSPTPISLKRSRDSPSLTLTKKSKLDPSIHFRS